MNAMELTGKDLIAYRTARLFKDGDVVNLGIGYAPPSAWTTCPRAWTFGLTPRTVLLV